MFCPMCGVPNEDDALYCGNCGAAMNADDGAGEVVTGEIKVVADELDEAGHQVLAQTEELREAAEEVGYISSPLPPPSVPSSTPLVPSTLPTSGLALASMLLGIGGLTLLPLIGSILAIIFGYMARRDIRQRPDRVSGDGLALAGIIMGWIAVGASVLIAVLALLGVGLGVCGVGLCGLTGTGY